METTFIISLATCFVCFMLRTAFNILKYRKSPWTNEIDGKLSDKTVDEYLLEDDVMFEWKKLTPITRKRIYIKIKE